MTIKNGRPAASNHTSVRSLFLAGFIFISVALTLTACASVTTPAPTATPAATATAPATAVESTPTTSAPVTPTTEPEEPTATRKPVTLPTTTMPPEKISEPTPEREQSQPTTEAAAPEETPVLEEEIQQPDDGAAPEEPVSESSAPLSGAIIIDHTDVERFNAIPDEYILAASELRMLFRHASVGANINDGLNCLMNNFGEARPNFCDRRVPPDQIMFDGKYDRSNWTFEVHNQPNPNPGWWKKVNLFTDRISGLGPDETYDVAAFTLGYVDGYPGSAIDDKFFDNDPDDGLPSIEDLEQLEADHPGMTLPYWTMGLARRSEIETQNFNQGLRDYAATNNKVLFDLADIESHSPDGSPCFDNADNGIEAICPDYTDEVNAGHLNAIGRQRLAKALWVLMARMAGWEG